MLNFFCLVCLFVCSSISALDVEILSDFGIEGLPAKLLDVKKDFNVNETNTTEYFLTKSPFRPELAKIIVFNPFFSREAIAKLPKEKLVLFVWEPVILDSELYSYYSRVYTWDDSLVDNVKFFRFNNPYLMPMRKSSCLFKDKKLCAMVVGNWTKKRQKLLKFFEASHPLELDCYGKYPTKLKDPSLYKGHIPGDHSGKEKISILSHYRFCLCFENTTSEQGYITEKIFSCFAAGCVPIYWGATNVIVDPKK